MPSRKSRKKTINNTRKIRGGVDNEYLVPVLYTQICGKRYADDDMMKIGMPYIKVLIDSELDKYIERIYPKDVANRVNGIEYWRNTTKIDKEKSYIYAYFNMDDSNINKNNKNFLFLWYLREMFMVNSFLTQKTNIDIFKERYPGIDLDVDENNMFYQYNQRIAATIETHMKSIIVSDRYVSLYQILGEIMDTYTYKCQGTVKRCFFLLHPFFLVYADLVEAQIEITRTNVDTLHVIIKKEGEEGEEGEEEGEFGADCSRLTFEYHTNVELSDDVNYTIQSVRYGQIKTRYLFCIDNINNSLEDPDKRIAYISPIFLLSTPEKKIANLYAIGENEISFTNIKEYLEHYLTIIDKDKQSITLVIKYRRKYDEPLSTYIFYTYENVDDIDNIVKNMYDKMMRFAYINFEYDMEINLKLNCIEDGTRVNGNSEEVSLLNKRLVKLDANTYKYTKRGWRLFDTETNKEKGDKVVPSIISQLCNAVRSIKLGPPNEEEKIEQNAKIKRLEQIEKSQGESKTEIYKEKTYTKNSIDGTWKNDSDKTVSAKLGMILENQMLKKNTEAQVEEGDIISPESQYQPSSIRGLVSVAKKQEEAQEREREQEQEEAQVRAQVQQAQEREQEQREQAQVQRDREQEQRVQQEQVQEQVQAQAQAQVQAQVQQVQVNESIKIPTVSVEYSPLPLQRSLNGNPNYDIIFYAILGHPHILHIPEVYKKCQLTQSNINFHDFFASEKYRQFYSDIYIDSKTPPENLIYLLTGDTKILKLEVIRECNNLQGCIKDIITKPENQYYTLLSLVVGKNSAYLRTGSGTAAKCVDHIGNLALVFQLFSSETMTVTRVNYNDLPPQSQDKSLTVVMMHKKAVECVQSYLDNSGKGGNDADCLKILEDIDANINKVVALNKQQVIPRFSQEQETILADIANTTNTTNK